MTALSDEEIHRDLFGRDPDFIATALPRIDLALRYFDPVVEGFENLPAAGPFLIVGNHSGGVYMPDFWAFLSRWFHERGTEAPLYSLGFDLLYSIPGVRDLVRRLGTVPASHENATRLLDGGAAVLVYPGGDEDDYRPWTQRHRVDLRGHTGFVRLALRKQVPVVPMVSHGSHDVLFVLTRGERLARLVGLDRLRIDILPIVAGAPWGVAPAQIPTIPMPAKVTVRVCEPFDWSGYGPDAADDEATVCHCYEEIVGRMQTSLDELVARLPHPIAARLTSVLRPLWPWH